MSKNQKETLFRIIKNNDGKYEVQYKRPARCLYHGTYGIGFNFFSSWEDIKVCQAITMAWCIQSFTTKEDAINYMNKIAHRYKHKPFTFKKDKPIVIETDISV